MITAVVDTSLSNNSSNFSRPENYSVTRLFCLKNNKLFAKIAIFMKWNLNSIGEFVSKIIMTIFTKPIVAEIKYETVRKHQFQLPNFKNKSFDFFLNVTVRASSESFWFSSHKNNRFWSHWWHTAKAALGHWENQ